MAGAKTASASSSVRCVIHGHCRSRVCIQFRSMVDQLSRCRCRPRVPVTFRRTNMRSFTRHSRAISDLKSDTAAARRTQLYIFDLKDNAAKRITEGPRATRDAMWIGDTIFFNSDRDGHFNLYAYNVSSGRDVRKSRSNRTWDVRWPSSDNEGQIVYELNGELQVLDAKSQEEHADFDQRS